ncbi:hypothetical protein QN277_026272 [Acacia crassicarpa]|uniref:Bulb-type lectin domain-containing protein n=1 Tax=Acacia crassicarpa TaxID=499986 RepID=A0AAE1JAH1_9FABA|nr:hypothetical protein QN277_026272 [Acacia crassicarpa]
MALITLFLLFAVLSLTEVGAQKNDSNIIALGSSLSPKTNSSSWVSPSRLFSFGFYPHDNGFAVGIWLMGEPEGTIVWTANITNLSNSSDSVELTKDGQLVLRNEKQMEVVAVIAKNASEPADSTSMLDSGNFVLYSKNRSVIWQSFDHPTDSILGGQNLSQGQHLISANGDFILNMQTDGKLFAYPVSHERENSAYWDPNTSQLDDDSQLTLNLTGFLCLGSYGGNIKVLAKSSNHLGRNTSLIIYRATLDLDGIFRLYVHTFEKNNNTGFTSQIIVWQAIYDQCQVNGFCGMNSYCSDVSGKGECKCYPGFRPINGNKNKNKNKNKNIFLVCEQIIKNDCITSGPGMLYSVRNPLQHMQWGLQ